MRDTSKAFLRVYKLTDTVQLTPPSEGDNHGYA